MASLLANGSFAGDAITTASALFYAVSMVRIHQKTNESESEGAVTGLAVDKVFYAAVIATGWVLGEVAYRGGDLNLWPGFSDPTQWLLILFISVGPSALSNILQVRSPTHASLLSDNRGDPIPEKADILSLFSLLVSHRVLCYSVAAVQGPFQAQA